MTRRSLPPLFLVALIVGVFLGLPQLFPKGFANGDAVSVEGLLHIPATGPEFATFTSLADLQENEALRLQRVQHGGVTCITPGNWSDAMRSATARARPEKGGGKAFWVRIVARSRFATGPCRQHYDSGSEGGQHWGSYLEIVSISDAQPIPCDSVLFILYKRRCPPAQPVRIPNRS